ncbi:hypothetical protein KEM52_001577 [Ascosphaera acerosa]|nr:hypothetical protein KEM52_001577 [Ascosphaera acerosa]
MSLITEYHDSLPYVDHDPSPEEREHIARLISRELAPEATQPAPSDALNDALHPLIPALREPQFSPLMQRELDRVAAKQPLTGGVDLTRYEAPEAPSSPAGAKSEEWRTVLQHAYAASTHLSMRVENLKLLDQHGKNTWLTANAETEAVLRTMEAEAARLKAESEQINRERRMRQESGRAELAALEESWRKSISGILEVEIAIDGLKRQILQRKRDLAH